MGAVTLNEFILENQQMFPAAKGELTRILQDIGIAAKIIHREVSKAGLVNILGSTENTNIQGETQQKLDVYAHNQLVAALRSGCEVAAVASEEEENIIIYENENSKNAKYIVAFDPLDGSSNIDVNASIGTIFAIFKRKNLNQTVNTDDFLQKGKDLIAAGYVIYGSSTMLIYSTGHGVNGFTLDPSIGEFCLSHPNIKIPENSSIYSINEGNEKDFPEGIKEYLKSIKYKEKPYSLRYIGSMVADIHRNLIKGGVFIYPPTKKNPDGKLRLIYECIPMAFLTLQAGGKAINFQGENILDLEPQLLHQRTSIIIGSSGNVDEVYSFLTKSLANHI